MCQLLYVIDQDQLSILTMPQRALARQLVREVQLFRRAGEEYVRLKGEFKHCSLYLWKQLEEAHELCGNIMADDTVPEVRSFSFLRAVLYQVARLQQIRANLQKALKTMILPNGYFDHCYVRLHELSNDYLENV